MVNGKWQEESGNTQANGEIIKSDAEQRTLNRALSSQNGLIGRRQKGAKWVNRQKKWNKKHTREHITHSLCNQHSDVSLYQDMNR